MTARCHLMPNIDDQALPTIHEYSLLYLQVNRYDPIIVDNNVVNYRLNRVQ